jgi:heme exporter protein D
MNQWAFVIGAYGLTLLATVALIVASWTSMRRSEAAAEASKRRP